MAAGNQTWSFVVPIEDSAFNNCLSEGVYKLAESMGKSTSKGKECTLCHLKFHKKDITKHTDLCKTEASRTRELAERFHTKVKQHFYDVSKKSIKKEAFKRFNSLVLSLVDGRDQEDSEHKMRCNHCKRYFVALSEEHKKLCQPADFILRMMAVSFAAILRQHAPVHRTGPATSDVNMVDETSRPSSSAAHDASAHSSGFAASDVLPKVLPAAHGFSSQPNGHLPQTTRMEVDAPSVSPPVYGSGSSQLKGQDAREIKMEVDFPSIVSPPTHVSTAPTKIPEGAIGPSSHQQQSKRQIEPKPDIHFKKPKSVAEGDSSAYRFHRSNQNTNPEVPIRQLQNVTSSSKAALTEARIIMSCHHVLYTMMTDKTTLTDTLSLYRVILEKIDNVSSFAELKAYVYSMFTETSNKSLFEFLCCLIYIGVTADNYKENGRLKNHKSLANIVYDDKSAKLKHSEKLYQRIAACWHAGVKVFHKKLQRDLTGKQVYFTEHAMIVFAINLLQNCNGTRGDSGKFENLLMEMHIQRDDVVKIGCALLVDYHQTNANSTSFTQIPRNSFIIDPARANDYVQMTAMFDQLEVPKFSLLDDIDNDWMHFRYALHLFMSLFTIRGRLVNWFVQRKGSAALLKELEGSVFIEISKTINSLLALADCQIDNCIEWAFTVWLRVFVVNVEVANAELSRLGRENRHKANINGLYSTNIEFISSAAEILASMIGLSVTTEDVVAQSKLYYENNYLQKTPAREYKKIIKFADLLPDVKPEIISHSKQEFSKLPLPSKCLTVVEPTLESQLIKTFIGSTTRIRHFNFTENLNYNCRDVHVYFKQIIPIFPMSHMFLNIY